MTSRSEEVGRWGHPEAEDSASADAASQASADAPVGAAPGTPVPALLRPGLKAVFVGYNPGLTSGRTGHHFAGPGNNFWTLLHEVGLTPHRLLPEEETELLELGLGITNLVTHVTRSSSGLTWAQMRAGGAELRARLLSLAPGRIVCLGKDVFRALVDQPRGQPLRWGLRRAWLASTPVDLLPNPSGANNALLTVQRELWRQLADELS